jgi:hypothetical protein
MAKPERAGRREEREKALWAEFEKFKAEGKPTGPSAFAKHVGFHRTYLYKFPSLAAELSAYGKRTQPHISKRGGGLTRAEAKKREIEAQVRREHTRWSKELPALCQEIIETKKQLGERDAKVKTLTGQLARLRRVYEHLLMLAAEAGVAPTELELMQNRLVEANEE